MSKLAAEKVIRQAPYQQMGQTAVAALTSDAERGLSSDEARGRAGRPPKRSSMSRAAATRPMAI